MRTPYIVTILVAKEDVEKANKALEDLGFGENNFDLNCDSHFLFAAPLQEWEKERIYQALDEAGVMYKHEEAENDFKVKDKVTATLSKESLTLKYGNVEQPK